MMITDSYITVISDVGYAYYNTMNYMINPQQIRVSIYLYIEPKRKASFICCAEE